MFVRWGSTAALAGIIASYVVLALTYNVLQPVWESPDEPEHFEFVRYLQVHHTLPRGAPGQSAVIDPNDLTKEFSQTPLYYVILAVALGPVPLGPGPYFHLNPFWNWPNHPWSHALAIHRPDEGWPFHGVSLFVHLGRLFAMLGGIVALLATYSIVKQTLGRSSDALFATAWLAWTPGFILGGVRLDNDGAAMGWSAAVLLLCVPVLLAPSRARTGRFALIGLALTGALLSKISTIYLVPIVVVAVIVSLDHRARPHPLPSPTGRVSLAANAALALGIPGAALLIWWLAIGRTFGGRIGSQAGLGVLSLGRAIGSLTLPRLAGALAMWNGTWWDGVGVGLSFGPTVMYTLLTIPFVALIGAGLWALVSGPGLTPAPPRQLRWREGLSGASRRRGPPLHFQWRGAGGEATSVRPTARLTAIVLCLSAGLLFYATIARQAFGSVSLDASARFTLPAAPILAMLVAIGARRLPLGGLRRPLGIVYLACLLGLAITTPFVFFPDLGIPIVPARLPANAQEARGPAIARFSNGVDLLALTAPSTLVTGQTLPITLDWRVERTPPGDFIAFVHLVGPNGQRLAGPDAIPLEKVYPPSLWQAGEIVDERRGLGVPAGLTPGNYRLEVGLYHLDATGQHITPVPMTSASPSADAATVDRWQILPDTSALASATPARATFGQHLTLLAYQIDPGGPTARARLYWSANAPIPRRLVVSVQALDSQGRLVAQNDREPVDGLLPTTTWTPGDVIRDDHDLQIPTSAARASQFIVAVYDRQTLQRLSVITAGQLTGDHFTLAPNPSLSAAIVGR